MTRDEAIAATTGPGQPYELVDAVVNGRQLRVFKHAPGSMRELFEATATDLPFLAYGDERWTYAEAWRAAARIGHVLVHDCGVKHGDRVAIAMRNYPEWVLAYTAITAIGAVAVGMNAHWQADEMAFALTDCDARVVFADTERLQRLAECPPEAGLAGLQVLAVRADEQLAAMAASAAWGAAAGARPLQALTDAAGDVSMPPARHRRRRPADDDVHLGLDRPPQGRAVHAPQRHRGAAVVGGRPAHRRADGRHRTRAARRAARHAAGRAAVPCHGAACLVPGQLPQPAPHGVHVPLGR